MTRECVAIAAKALVASRIRRVAEAARARVPQATRNPDRERLTTRWLRSDPFPQYSHLDRLDGRGPDDPRTR